MSQYPGTAALTQRMLMALALSVCLMGLSGTAWAQTVEFIYPEPAGLGFNDPTPATPVGGNPGTTVGDQRRIAIELAGQIWSNIVLATQTVRVRAVFGALTCDANSAVLGSASPQGIFSDFGGAAQPDTWYVSALADTLGNSDREPDEVDLRANFNRNIDNNNACLSGRSWYYGLDSNPPGNDIDFLNTVMHEIGHGLGFLSLVNVTTGALPSSRPTIFDRFAFDGSQGLYLSDMTDAQRRDAVRAGSNLVFDGGRTNLFAQSKWQSGFGSGGFTRLYAPNTVRPGSTLSHFDTSASPNALMEPFLSGSLRSTRDVDLTANFMADIGWSIADIDEDLVTDVNDNCVTTPNVDQFNGDADDFGNACDADLDGDGTVNIVDLGLLRQRFFSADPAADLNGDGVVNIVDLGRMRVAFFRAPGPTGLVFP
ncbi:MAG: thrombospondin type 3 repeat-containing protein [Gammaproteobacteria bacterium]